jgi:formylglycine-generating enzyme required for sulfatase activity
MLIYLSYGPLECVPWSRDAFYNFAPVGSYPNGASPYGALDMIGNVWEWVEDWYDETYYAQSPEANPHGPLTGEYRLLRGGSSYDNARIVTRLWQAPERWASFGFRCVKDANP